MKKILTLVALTLVFLCLLVSCSGQGGTQDNNQNQNGQPQQPAHTHSFGDWETTKNPTCQEDGIKARYCDCGEKQSDTIPSLSHTEVVDEAIAPTCTVAGKTEGKHCATCNQVIVAQSDVAKVEHIYSGDFDATCEVCGFTRDVNCSHSKIVILPAKDATCSETGLTEGMICPYCNTVLIKQEVIPTIDHTFNSTYSFDNSFHWYACNDCGAKENVAEHQAADDGMCSVCDQPVGATEGIVYDISLDGTYAEVIAYNGTAQKIRIADTYQGLPVTTIYSKAFYENKTITSAIIPDSVTSIGDYAFNGCSSLSSVVIGDNVTSIGDYAFNGCSALISIVIPDSVTSIGDYAFSYCYSLTSVVIGDSVTTIGGAAFYNCSSLSSIVIGDSVTSIGNYAFSYCYSLKFNEYENCKYLGDEDNPYFALIEVSTENLSNYAIHEDTKVIADYAFDNCSRLTSIVIPDGVISIGDYAFEYCSSLTSVVISDSVTSIGDYAFEYCSSLTSIVIPDSVTSIDNSAFSRCSSLSSVVIGDSVTSIGDYAFYDCSNLTSVVIPDSVTSIGNSAFEFCSSLKDVYYIGSEEEWGAITIDYNNYYLTGAAIHYNYVPEN